MGRFYSGPTEIVSLGEYFKIVPTRSSECSLQPSSELFQAFGPKKINLLKWPDGQSKSSGFVTLASKEKAQESIDRLNMKITLEGSLMPLAVKFSGGSRKRSRTDFDAPANGNCPTSKPYHMVHMI